MWICLTHAFLSIVSKDCAPDELLVRARRKGDIERTFPGVKAKRDALADYRFRAVVKRQAVHRAMFDELARVTYPNFKDAVPENDLHNAYLSIWSRMEQLQPAPTKRERAARARAGKLDFGFDPLRSETDRDV